MAQSTTVGPRSEAQRSKETGKYPVEVLLALAEEQPKAPWLFQPVGDEEKVYTWADGAEQVGRMAAALKGLDLAPGSRIGISGLNTAHWLMADLAIAMAGHVGVGLYPKQSPSAVTYILEHSEADALFVGPMPDAEEFMEAVPDGVKTIAFPYDGVADCDLQWDELAGRHEPLKQYTPPPADDLLTLIYTSGSTGKPKGVMITYGNLSFAIEGFMKALPATDDERVLSYLPLAHVFERAVVGVGSLYYRAEVHFLKDIRDLATALPRIAPTRFYGVPLVYGRIQSGVLKQVSQQRLNVVAAVPVMRNLVRRRLLEGVGLQNARVCISGAAPLPQHIAEWFEKYLGLEICQGYSMTENLLYATSNLPGENKIGSVGRPLPGCELKLSDEGEVLIKHPAVMKGYYKDAERTKETLTSDGWLRTGDRGKIDDDGYLFITGRVKEIFKTQKGKYVAPAPIEEGMSDNPDIDQLCLVGSGLNQPILLITLTDDARDKPREEVEKSLVSDMESTNKTLEPHEKIGKLLMVKDAWTIDNGLMTPTMKVKRNEVEERYAELIEKEAQERNQIAWEE